MKKNYVSTLALALVLGIASTGFSADINKDDAATIAKDGLGIGPKKAELIVTERTAKGPFKDWEDLKMRVKGFGPATIEKNKDTLTFGTTAIAPATVPTTAPVAPVAPTAMVPAAPTVPAIPATIPATVPAR